MSYRDELAAAREIRNALARELRGIEGRMEALTALGERKRQLEQALRRSARDIEHMRPRTSLPVLANVREASPCRESWVSMPGDDRLRVCKRCHKQVFDLSSMTDEQAEALLAEHGASMFVRLYRRHDGTVLTSDCPVRRQSRRRRKLGAAAVVGVLLVVAVLLVFRQPPRASVGDTESDTASAPSVVELEAVELTVTPDKSRRDVARRPAAHRRSRHHKAPVWHCRHFEPGSRSICRFGYPPRE